VNVGCICLPFIEVLKGWILFWVKHIHGWGGLHVDVESLYQIRKQSSHA
jgi:hypothetical protein